jgi:predicted RNA-binding protein associated with RNAse of E/G family
MTTVTVIKRDYRGNETWRYAGELVERRAHVIVIEAFFDREDTPVDGLVLRGGDRFVETYYDDRWYNIFEVHDPTTEEIKGWYCNVGWPAEFENNTISYRDLALDLLVFADGRQKVLDEDEFDKLPIDTTVREKALAGLAELRERFGGKDPAVE